MLKETESVGGVVLNLKDKIMVVDQQGSSWSLPKGHVENDESLLETAKREIYEESGITELEVVKELGSYKRFKLDSKGKIDKNERKTIHMFLFKTTQEKLTPIDPENPEARWVDPKEAVKLLTHPKDKKFLSNALRNI